MSHVRFVTSFFPFCRLRYPRLPLARGRPNFRNDPRLKRARYA